jgi:hypothetical protein
LGLHSSSNQEHIFIHFNIRSSNFESKLQLTSELNKDKPMIRKVNKVIISKVSCYLKANSFMVLKILYFKLEINFKAIVISEEVNLFKQKARVMRRAIN